MCGKSLGDIFRDRGAERRDSDSEMGGLLPPPTERGVNRPDQITEEKDQRHVKQQPMGAMLQMFWNAGD